MAAMWRTSSGMGSASADAPCRACIEAVKQYFACVKKASEYRAHASECRELAAKMERAADRELLLAMAAHWEQLARDRTELIEKHPELGMGGDCEHTEEPDARACLPDGKSAAARS